MLIKNIGFCRFFIHIQSVLASFGGASNHCCVVNIGHTSLTVSTVEDGIVTPDSTIIKYFGGCDIDLILKTLIEAKNAI
jgi:Actin